MDILAPTASPNNPYRQILNNNLTRGESHSIFSPDLGFFFPFIRNGVLSKNIDVIHLDWKYRQLYMSDHIDIIFLKYALSFMKTIVIILDLVGVYLSATGLVWTVHDKYHHEKKYLISERVINEVLFLVSNETILKCAEAESILNEYYTFTYRSSFTVVRDGNYRSWYPDNVNCQEARKHLSVEKEAFVYLFFGTIRAYRGYKGIDRLINKFMLIPDADVELWIVGNPMNCSAESEIKQKCEQDPRISTVLEYIPRESVQYYLNMADILVVPYREVLNSGTMYLALTFGLPVIAPQKGCIDYILSNRNRELLYNDPCSELAPLLRSVRFEYNTDNIGNANYCRGDEFEWDHPAEKHLELYKNSASNLNIT